MTGTQHQIVGIGFGIAGGIIGLAETGDMMSLVIPIGAALSCKWADMDHNSTKLGRKRKVVTSTLSKLLGFVANTTITLSVGLLILHIVNIFSIGNYLKYLLLAAMASGIYIVLSNTLGNSKAIKWAKKHRGIMHTLLVPALLFVTSDLVDQTLWKFIFIGFTVGYISHIVADSVTPDKVPALWPITTKPVGITLVRKDKTDKDDKEAKRLAEQKFQRKCTRLAYLLSVTAVVGAVIYSFGGF